MPDRDEDLLAELKWLRHNQADLDARLQRVEESLIFRTLRAIGTFYQTHFRSTEEGSAEEYRGWAARHVNLTAIDPAWVHQPVIGIRGDEASLRSQTYTKWRNGTDQADYWAELPAGVVLKPGALASAVEAIQSFQPGTIYFDHEIADESGEPARPVFKPDWSPTLMESCDYLGPFVLRSATPRDGAVHIPRIAYSTRSELSIRQNPPIAVKQPLVSVLICTRNSELLARCLASLRANTKYPAIETIVIHHRGTEHDEEILKLVAQSGTKCVPFDGVFNFSEMNNLGARAAAGEILLFLNDDVEPLDALWLERMVARLERPETGAVGAKLLYYDGTIQHAGLATWEMGGAGHPGRFMKSCAYWPWLNCSREVTAVTGACMAVRRSDFDRVNGFDPAFPVNFNDVDLCLRLNELGLKTVFEASAVLQHDDGQTRSAGVGFEERRRFFLRWRERLEKIDPYYTPNLVQHDESLRLRD